MNGPHTARTQSNSRTLALFVLSFLLPIMLGWQHFGIEATSDTEIINTLMSRGYDWRVRPPGTNLSIPGSHGPVIVQVDMLIRSISKIDDVNMEYSVQLTFRESWVDGRLAYGLPNDTTPPFVILTAGQQIWMPDTFFQNEKHAQKHMIDKPNVLIRVHKDGVILYSVRISLVLSCPMHLQYYPLDVQTCLIDLASYAYTTDDIEYVWKDIEPVQLKQGLHSSLPSFQLGEVNTTYCTSKTNTGAYSCLRTILQLQRQFSYYLLQLYIPSTMLVIVSWVSFWLDRTAVPARVTLGVTTLLTMTTQASGINAKLPPVSYGKAIDIWCGACLTFIFSALLEFACVTYMASRMFYKTKTRNVSMAGLTFANKNGHHGSCVNLAQPAPVQLVPTRPPPPSYLTSTPLLLANYSAIQQIDEDAEDHSGEDQVWVKQKPAGAMETVVLRRDPEPQRDLESRPLSAFDTSLHLPKPTSFKRTSILQRRRSPIMGFFRRLPPIRWMLKQLEIEDRAKRADYISRIAFPIAFIVFNIAYWVRYLN
ncbi:neurotransmitter-gated ion-channel ligand binding domain-containing protein [Ditylenchus destructor]|uniref:Neurotransmitter-gated ion-channel ligand binding domain-containing protein n=1 Tax=Ditylenchus destructor TaxID=166010 RepID=A0AAD4MYP8_9BILA|nr:neurotransmitter-gated ion-channel ligand binding domain-containing protein [Ditylenchus destructor]